MFTRWQDDMHYRSWAARGSQELGVGSRVEAWCFFSDLVATGSLRGCSEILYPFIVQAPFHQTICQVWQSKYMFVLCVHEPGA